MSICWTSSAKWTRRCQESCKRSCQGYFKQMPKMTKKSLLSLLLLLLSSPLSSSSYSSALSSSSFTSHLFSWQFLRNYCRYGRIVNTPLEPLWFVDVPFGFHWYCVLTAGTMFKFAPKHRPKKGLVGIFKPNLPAIKIGIAYYRHYCMDSNHFFRNDKSTKCSSKLAYNKSNSHGNLRFSKVWNFKCG